MWFISLGCLIDNDGSGLGGGLRDFHSVTEVGLDDMGKSNDKTQHSITKRHKAYNSWVELRNTIIH